VSIPNLQKLINTKIAQNSGFMKDPAGSDDKEKISNDMANLFEALFKYLEASNKQTLDILKVISHNQRVIMSKLGMLEVKENNEETNKEIKEE
jgi:hypothetical protein